MNNDNLFQRNKREREKQGMLHSQKGEGEEQTKGKRNKAQRSNLTFNFDTRHFILYYCYL